MHPTKIVTDQPEGQLEARSSSDEWARPDDFNFGSSLICLFSDIVSFEKTAYSLILCLLVWLPLVPIALDHPHEVSLWLARLRLYPCKAVALFLMCLVVTPLTVSRTRSMTTRRQPWWLLGLELASFQNCSASNMIVRISGIRTVLSSLFIFRWAIKIAGGCYFL